MTCDPLTREECCDGTPCADCCPDEGACPTCGCPASCPEGVLDGYRAAFDNILALSAPEWVSGPDGDFHYGRGYAAALADVRRILAPPRPTAPPLSPTEQATVDRFEAAPDPWED